MDFELEELISFKDDYKNSIKNIPDDRPIYLSGVYSTNFITFLMLFDMENNTNLIFPAAFNENKRKIFLSRFAKEKDLEEFLNLIEDYISRELYYN